MKGFPVLLLTVLLTLFLAGKMKAAIPQTASVDSAWVDSVMNSLTLEQKIAQLMIIRVASNLDSVTEDTLVSQVKSWNPGGICFFKGTPLLQVALTNRLQQVVQTPLIISIDAEWGLGMRLDSTVSFPRQMTLGALEDDSLVYEMASAIAWDCKRIGVNLNFAPVVDINNNPANPVIGSRSYGEDKKAVARKGIAYMHGLQDHGVFATAKHFPGHGDTDTDSHLALPVVPFPETRLDSVELFPFKALIREGIDGVMTGHLFVPALDSLRIPATLSPEIVTRLLRGKLLFKGFTVTDALDMKGVTSSFKPGEIEVKALLAGNDILLLPQNIGVAVKAICLAVDSGIISVDLLNEKCRKILTMKSTLGLAVHHQVNPDSLVYELNPISSEVLKRKLFKNAITVVKNENNLIPLNFLEYKKIVVLSIGDTNHTPFQEMIARYAALKKINLSLPFDSSGMACAIHETGDANLVIIAVHTTTNLATKRFGIPTQVYALIDSLASRRKIILDIFGSPYALSQVPVVSKIETILISYQNEPIVQEASAEIIFGGIAANGHLPVTGSAIFPLNTGIRTPADRFEYILSEEAGISSEALKEIDSIALEGIQKQAYPGCQVLFAKNGKIFYEKSFGSVGYNDPNPVTRESIYDLASLTKVIATTLAVMRLYDEGKIQLDENLGSYLPELTGSNKENLTIREVMTHQAGLQPWIPFFEKTMKDRRLIPGIYDSLASAEFPFQVAENLFMRKDYRDTVFSWIIASPLRPVKDYKYSDLGFYLLARIVERVTHQDFSRYTDSVFYQPLGLQTMGFHPLNRFPASRIMPTENDLLFRNQLLRGYVHDPGAAMLGGVAGHAGLFSNSTDLAIILRMLLNGGEYGGRQYLIPSTIREFTRVQFPENHNRRGIGFDKPPDDPSPDGPVCPEASPSSFGHSGFTGTYIWADPENGLIYVFLSNRVFPDASNQKLAELNIRTRIHTAMYRILKQARID